MPISTPALLLTAMTGASSEAFRTTNPQWARWNCFRVVLRKLEQLRSAACHITRNSAVNLNKAGF
jgi:aminoglycoside phosphotransferase